MNLSRTALFFGLLLSMLWIFGLLVAYKKVAPEESALVPSMRGPDIKIDSIAVKKGQGKKAEAFDFVRDGDSWYLQQDGQKVKLETFKVEEIANQVKNAARSEELRPSPDLATFGLDRPERTVVLKGTRKDEPREWTFYVGKESPDHTLLYVNSSDRRDRAYAVAKQSVDALFFKDSAALRPRRLFDFSDASATGVSLQQGDKQVVLQRDAKNLWRFEKPALGFAGFESAAPAPKDGKETPPPSTGVKGLLDAIGKINVGEEEDFVAPGEPLDRYGLTDGKEALRIEVDASSAGEKKSREVLLVGSKVPQRQQYYARRQGDDGVVQVAASALVPVQTALRDPGAIRSKDISAIDPKNVDYVVLHQGQDEVKLERENDEWQLRVGSAAPVRANAKAVQALLEGVQGKGAIQKFEDPADAKKFDAEWGLDKPGATVAVHTEAFEKPAKDEGKKSPPTLKKDAAPAVTLAFGKVDKDAVQVKRTLPDGTESRFTLAKAILAKVEPEEGVALAYRDLTLPAPAPADVTAFELRRGKEKLEFEKTSGDRKTSDRWYIKDAQEPGGRRPADLAKVNLLLEKVARLQARKWVEPIGPKTDLAKLGLDHPSTAVSMIAKTERLTPASVAGVLGTATPLGAMTAVLAGRELGEPVSVEFGKETDKDSVHARQSNIDLVFLAPAEVAKLAREVDPRDRTVVLNLTPEILAGQLGLRAAAPSWLLTSPLATGVVQALDPAKVQEMKIAIRKPEELRSFTFRRADKGWEDATGLQEFQLDPERVTPLLDTLARLRAERLVALSGGPRADQKLAPREAVLRVDLVSEGGQTTTLLVGADFEHKGYFATSSAWPEVVFLLPSSLVEPIVRNGVGYFSKERVAAAP